MSSSGIWVGGRPVLGKGDLDLIDDFLEKQIDAA